jgi:hypothetical protein
LKQRAIISAKIHLGAVAIIERSDSEKEPGQKESLLMKLLLEELTFEDGNSCEKNPPELIEPGLWQPQTETVRHEIYSHI